MYVWMDGWMDGWMDVCSLGVREKQWMLKLTTVYPYGLNEKFNIM